MAFIKFLLSVNITIDCMNDRVKARMIKEEVYFFPKKILQALYEWS